MSWKIRPNGPGLMATGGTLSLGLEFVWEGREVVETAVVEMWVDCMGMNQFWTTQRIPLGPQELTPGPYSNSITQCFPLATDDRRLQLIETKRNGGGPLSLNIHASVYARSVFTATIPVGSSSMSVRSLGPPVAASTSGMQLAIGRDEWLSILRALGWSETEVFEVRAEPFRSNERLGAALVHLRASEDAMRLGHWASAVTEARKAVEVAAEIDGEMDAATRRASFEKLVMDVFPDQAVEPRRATAGMVMQSLAHFRNEGGAHGSVRFQLERADAELSFRVATALFRYLGAHLASRGGANGSAAG